MKIIKTTHYRNHEESETSDYTLFESNGYKKNLSVLVNF